MLYKTFGVHVQKTLVSGKCGHISAGIVCFMLEMTSKCGTHYLLNNSEEQSPNALSVPNI